MTEGPGAVYRRHAGEQVLIDLIDRHPELIPCVHAIREAVSILTGTFAAGGKLVVCGNGGSAADASHIAAEMMKNFRLRRPFPPGLRVRLADSGEPALAERLQPALPTIALTGASPLATAIANDIDAAFCFAQQVLGYGQRGDTLLALSTSGNARNVLAAVRTARALGMATIGLTGQDGGKLAPLVDLAIKVPATETYRVQELHMPVYHAVCAAVEEAVFGAVEGE